MVRPKGYCIYKPRKTKNGSASSWTLNVDKDCMFLEMSQQREDDDKKFDWDNKLIMKLGVPDIGALISVLEKRESDIKLFHKNDGGNSILKITTNESGGWFIAVCVKKEDDSN